MTRNEKSKQAVINLIGHTVSKPYIEERMTVKYFGLLGTEIVQDEVAATKYTNPDNGQAVVELDEWVEGVKFIPMDELSKLVVYSILFYDDTLKNPYEFYKQWAEGQIEMENNRHYILLNRYEDLLNKLKTIK